MLAWFCAGVTCWLTLQAFLTPWIGWPGDLASHFLPQYTLFMLLAGVIMLLYQNIAGVMIVIPFLVWNLINVAPYYIPVSMPLSLAEAKTLPKSLKVLQANVLYVSDKPQAALQLIEETKPDIAALQELTTPVAEILPQLTSTYPYQLSFPREDAFGIAVVSRYPLTDVKITPLGKLKLPMLIATVTVKGQPVSLVVAHPIPPTSQSNYEDRNLYLKALGNMIDQEQQNMVLMGDLNNTPWTPSFHQLLEETGLHDSQMGFGVQPSWPSDGPFLQIPIDHVLVSQGVQIDSRRTVKISGSDHLAVVAELGFQITD
ncbi:MAG: endonuclease/exonuclease/phosphatase family protein [Vampirovibrio sp.]|nr:endonuclease/exonuclease/phosphatase family protein [Vampirovibrio sp.]